MLKVVQFENFPTLLMQGLILVMGLNDIRTLSLTLRVTPQGHKASN
jgi:hypothetical protein